LSNNLIITNLSYDTKSNKSVQNTYPQLIEEKFGTFNKKNKVKIIFPLLILYICNLNELKIAMMKRFSILLLILMAANISTIFAQSGIISFESTTNDFGTIKEEIGKVTTKFYFTNVGSGDLKLVNVKPSCGCTSSEYSKEIIKPGEKGFVSATYFTANRPGPFRKSITVTTNDVDRPNTILFIKGTVTPLNTSAEDELPISIGNLKLMTNHLAFNDIKSNEIKVDSVKIYNKWGHPMNIGFQEVPSNVKIEAIPAVLESGEFGYIKVTYDAKKRNDFGLIFDRIAISTNDNVQPIKVLNISARIIEDFSKLNERDLKKSPIISFKETDFDFGNVVAGTVVKHNFVFTNQGKSDLIIRKKKSSCGCTTADLKNSVIKKGKTGSIDIEFNTSGRKDREHKTVTIITNDPKNHEIVLNIHGEISEK